MGAEGEADQVGIVVDVHTIRVDLVDHGRDLKASQKMEISAQLKYQVSCYGNKMDGSVSLLACLPTSLVLTAART